MLDASLCNVDVSEAIAVGIGYKGVKVGRCGGLRLGNWPIVRVERIRPYSNLVAITNPVPICVRVERVSATRDFIAIGQAITIISSTTVEDPQSIGGCSGGIGTDEGLACGNQHGGAHSIRLHREGKQVTGLERCQCRKARIQRNHIGCAFLVWVRLKELAAQTGRTVYQRKHGLLDDYLIQQLRNPSCRMILA